MKAHQNNMKITKLGHCCLLVETQGVTILTDPGVYTIDQVQDVVVDIILITHEHADHYHVPSIQAVRANNPKVVVVTNTSVQRLLQEEGIEAVVIEDGSSQDIAGAHISGHGNAHAQLHSTIPQIQNTGFVIDETLYHPGDAFHVPNVGVDILALPVAGPWMKIGEAVDFALAVKPSVAFPVHDDVLAVKSGGAYIVPEKVLTANGIEWCNEPNNTVMEF
jgi:L-ascorbate metabolism protein UlaG (beta-lactamase superfamily)